MYCYPPNYCACLTRTANNNGFSITGMYIYFELSWTELLDLSIVVFTKVAVVSGRLLLLLVIQPGGSRRFLCSAFK